MRNFLFVKSKHFASIMMLTAFSILALGIYSCSNDRSSTEESCENILKNNLKKLEDRVSALEKWQKSVNTNIKSLQDIVTALQERNYITSVEDVLEGADKVGYKINFYKGNPVFIKHGKDGSSPIIGVTKESDGVYYWTVKIGSGVAELLKDESGNKIPATGAKGDKGNDAIAPKLKIDETTNEWQISIDGGNSWETTGVKATGNKGDKGDSMFESVDVSDSTKVTFRLSDGNEVVVPRISGSIAFDSYDTFLLRPNQKEIKIVLPDSFKESDYVGIMAELKSDKGVDIAIATRSGEPVISVVKPTFNQDGICNNDSKVVIRKSKDCIAILKVTLVDSKGKETSVSRRVDMRMRVKNDGEFYDSFDCPGAVLLEENIEVEHFDLAKGEELVLDLDNKKISLSGNTSTTLHGGNLTIKNGTVDFINRTNYRSDIMLISGSLTVENVIMNSTAMGILAQGNESKLTIRNSTVNSKYYALTSNASFKYGELMLGKDAEVVLENSNFIAEETALMYNVPAKFNIRKCNFEGNHQAAVLRGGTYIIENSSFVLKAELQATHSDNKHNAEWGQGNQVPFAAITMGNRHSTSYKYPTKVSLFKVDAKVEGTNASSFPAVYVYANSESNLGVMLHHSDTNFISGYNPSLEFGSTNIFVNGSNQPSVINQP